MSIGIDVQYSIAHIHTHNRLAKSFIKHLKLITRPLLLNTKLPLSARGHAIIHTVNLIHLRPTTNQGCAVYVALAPTHRTKLGPQLRLGIYVGFQSSSIINYIEPLTC